MPIRKVDCSLGNEGSPRRSAQQRQASAGPPVGKRREDSEQKTPLLSQVQIRRFAHKMNPYCSESFHTTF